MSRVLESLDLLHSEPGIMRHSPFVRPIDGLKECAPLIKARDKLRSQVGEVKLSAPPLDPKQVWQRFEQQGACLTRLNPLEVRTLCMAGECATRPAFVQALSAHPHFLRNCRCLCAMVNSYFTRWRGMEAPDELEALLKQAIDRYPRKSPAIDRWRGAQSLFTAKAAEALAEFIIARRSNIDTILKLQYVGTATRLAVLTRAKAAELGAKRFAHFELTCTEDVSLQYLRWMLGDVLTEPLLPGALSYAISALILSRSAERWESFQRSLQAYIQNHPRLGDPRLRQSMPNWRDVNPEAQQRFLSWLAKENILFFFDTILPRNDENRRRADFWLRYHKQITDFQVAISEQDLWKLNANKSNRQLPLHSRVSQASTSAFLMRFKGYHADYVVIEFSETGNAAYIYDRAAFESTNVNLRTPQFRLYPHLKHSGWPDRILHIRDWEFSARQRLAELGIVP